jgi:hypothetical protein
MNPLLRKIFRTKSQQGAESRFPMSGNESLLQALRRDLYEARNLAFLMEPAAERLYRFEPGVAGDWLHPALTEVNNELLEVGAVDQRSIGFLRRAVRP